jgi:heat shock protein HspQ
MCDCEFSSIDRWWHRDFALFCKAGAFLPGILRACLLQRERRNSVPMKVGQAKFGVGQVVRHRFFPFRGVIFDVDPIFANTDEWYEAIPEEIRPAKDQPFYHLLAENDETEYVAYVSEQNLLPDESGEPVRHPQVRDLFESFDKGVYRARSMTN